MPTRGRHPHNKLTDLEIRKRRPGKYADGNGLYLWVRDAGTRQWVQRLVIQRTRHDSGLGAYPLVGLAEARRIALENRRIARAGGDPRTENPRKKGPTVRQFYPVVTENRRTNWKTAATAASWQRGFENDIFPTIGDTLVAAVTVGDIRRIVVPHWNGRNSRGYLLRQNLEYFFDCAIVEHHRLDNPAATLKRVLPKVKAVVNHRPSLPYCEAPEALAAWQALAVNPAIKLAVLFIVLTAARLGEATGATWREIDLPGRLWQVPEERMKARRGTYGSSLPSGARGPPAGSRVESSVFADLPSRRSHRQDAADQSGRGLGRVEEAPQGRRQGPAHRCAWLPLDVSRVDDRGDAGSAGGL